MTVSTEISSNEYTGNGVTTDFDYKFRIFKANQLSVIISDADGDNVVTLRLGTDYTVTGANKSAGGKVILTKPLANGHKISIARDIPITQETSFRNQSKFFAETHEDAFDYLTMILQRIWGSLGSLYLKRPNILANWFDAKGYRIANLGKPKRDSDAVDLGTLKDEISGVNSTILKCEKRLLRVDDMDISALPKASERAGNVLTFDKDGKPIVIAPASGSAVDVLNQLSSENGASIIGIKKPFTNSIKRTVLDCLSEEVSPFDFIGGTFTEKMQAAVDYV
ncbi:phage tail fiber protein, partial [Providencia huaxiensis]